MPADISFAEAAWRDYNAVMLHRHRVQKNHVRAAWSVMALGLLISLAVANRAWAQATAPAPSPQDAQREQAITDFTQKMKDANYPALFDRAAAEFNVPPDVLKAVSFAETRWTQLQWPPGETASPDNGMPHAYGIMSLWDNDIFGHTLQQAAQLIGEDPSVLQTNVFENMRGGAALLRQLYDQTPKPADATDPSQIESWREAIAKYTGIPQPELSQSHALRVYEYMNLGYHEYGIEWKAHPVNLGPMRADVARIKAAAHPITGSQTNTAVAEPVAPITKTAIITQPVPVLAVATPVPTEQSDAERFKQRWLLIGLMVTLLIVGAWRFKSRKQ